MAKSTKKPNSFTKGMMSDLDPNVITPDSYKSATNARILTREDNSFVLKNAKGNTLLDTITFNTTSYTFSDTTILANSTISALTDEAVFGFKVTISGNSGFTNVSKFFQSGGTNTEGEVLSNGNGHSGRDYLRECIVQLLADSTVLSKIDISVPFNKTPGSTEATINFTNLTNEVMSLKLEAYIKHSDGSPAAGYFEITNGAGYASTSYTGTNYSIVGSASFSDYIVLLATPSNTAQEDIILKVKLNDSGALSTRETILSADLGLEEKTSVRIEVSEENEHFHRIYWTDGVRPLRTVNLKENAGYYVGLSADDLNVFKDSNLPAPEVNSIVSGGKVLCGSHSYCYRLITGDGKTSIASALTNPIHVAKSSQDTAYHENFGGSLSTESSNAVTLSIDNIDQSYTAIQIIDVRYVSKQGAIEANIISESNISGSSFEYTHNGNETTTSITVAELLRASVSWDTCKDLAKKDNRLFAANLINNAQSITASFRVKSYNGSFAAHTEVENPDIHETLLYDGTNYAYLNNPLGNNTKIPGAQSAANWGAATDGVRVTFRTKKFDLSGVNYFASSKVKDTTSADTKAATTINEVPHFGYIDKTGEGGYFNNYKNPLFSEKYTGYQRGEIYRFGILFYDKGGNPTFVSPIGDIRMPDGNMDYSTLSDDGTTHVTAGDDGVSTFKHAGNISTTISGWTTVGGSAITTVTGNGSSISIGDVVTGTGIAKGTFVTGITGTTSITISNAVDLGGSGTALTFDTPTDDIYGFVMYPRFEVKLSADTRSKIGGYAIVRVDRTDSDKSILASGVLNQSMIYSDNSSNRTMRHYNGPSYANIYSPLQTHESVSNSTFLFDTPESTLGSLNYSSKTTDTLKVVGVLDGAQSPFTEDEIPNWSDVNANKNMMHLRVHDTDGDTHKNLISGRFDPKSNTTNQSYQFSQYVIYSQFSYSLTSFNQATLAESLADIGYGANIAPSGQVSKSKMGYDADNTGSINRPFKNRARWASSVSVLMSNPQAIATHKFNSEANSDSAFTVEGCPSIFVSLKTSGNQTIKHLDFEIGVDDNNASILNYNNTGDALSDAQLKLYAQKLYTQICRDVSELQYGGNSTAAYEKNQYISTGNIDFNPAASNFVDVFGGDTFINMYALQKWKAPWSIESNWKQPSTAIIFPVESTVNIDLRDGIFFGAQDDTSYKIHDNFLLNETYSCRNTTKTFLQKPVNFKDVNQYSNMVAASNLKINGDLFDAFTTWDANEIHELETGKGPIYNLFNLRGDLFTLQQSGVAKLSINPRVVVDNADIAAVTVVTGTGQIIERHDYVDDKYGSQHYNNAISTSTSAYWYDSNMSSFCKLDYGQGIAVQDLGLVTQNANIFNALKNVLISDKPLDKSVGGIHIYHNKIFNEIGVCITTAANAITHMVYSELHNVMVSKKEDVVVLSATPPGELITVGRNSADSTQINYKIWKEDSNASHLSYYGTNNTNSMEIEFVCNENVYTSKKFDKLVLYLSGNENTKKFTTFTFTDSVSNTPFTSNDSLSKMANGKHIIPVTSTDGTGKATGAYLIIKAVSTATDKIELFGAIVHNRPTI